MEREPSGMNELEYAKLIKGQITAGVPDSSRYLKIIQLWETVLLALAWWQNKLQCAAPGEGRGVALGIEIRSRKWCYSEYAVAIINGARMFLVHTFLRDPCFRLPSRRRLPDILIRSPQQGSLFHLILARFLTNEAALTVQFGSKPKQEPSQTPLIPIEMLEEQKHQNEKPNHIQDELTQLSTKPTKSQRLKDIEDLLNAHLKRGEPKEPTPDECCGNGCSPCVWDTYYSKLDVYMDKRDQLESKKVEIEEEDDSD